MSWRDHPDAQALLAACKRVDAAFGGGLTLELVRIDGVRVAGVDKFAECVWIPVDKIANTLKFTEKKRGKNV